MTPPAPGFATETVLDGEVGVRVDVPAGWRVASASHGGDQAEVLVAGVAPAEGLSVERMRNAEPGVERWVEVAFALVGSPTTSGLLPLDVRPTIHEWIDEGAEDGEDADEARRYEGLLTTADAPSDLRRVHVLLVRRGTDAWKVVLSLASACPPGTPGEVVAAQDHTRAAAVLGTLDLG